MQLSSQSHEKLSAWQQAMELSVDCYKLVGRFPTIDRLGLETQITHTVIEIPQFIADACVHRKSQVFLENLTSALACIAKLETLILVAERLYYCNSEQKQSVFEKTEEVRLSLIRMRREITPVPSTTCLETD